MRLRKENGGKRESSTPVKDKEKFRNAALSPSPPLLSSFLCRAAGEKLKNRKGEKNVCLGEEASEKRCVGKGKKREEKIPGRKNSGGGMELSEKRPGKVSSAGKFCSEAEEYVTLCSRSIPPLFSRGGWNGMEGRKSFLDSSSHPAGDWAGESRSGEMLFDQGVDFFPEGQDGGFSAGIFLHAHASSGGEFIQHGAKFFPRDFPFQEA